MSLSRSLQPLVRFHRYYSAAATESLVVRLKEDRKRFMKAKKQPELNVVKGVLSDFTYYIKSPNFTEGSSEESAILSVIQKSMKRRQDSIQQFTAGGRPELAQQEMEELQVLKGYLPEAMSPEAIEREIEALLQTPGLVLNNDLGAFMKAWKHSPATADRKVVSEIARRLLSKEKRQAKQ
ncbi:Yqey-like protein-domain-containing protein [Sporodiniella umbellata]|nr:Yqey-like protein-domain-containing protein [Sporodiniella umbellata]